MWHLFSDKKPWFAEKRYGYGAGLPIAWQGWVLLLVYIGAMLGLGLLMERARGMELVAMIVLVSVLTVLLVAIVRARTPGKWRWRWGDDE